jgi:hypothetical protein
MTEFSCKKIIIVKPSIETYFIYLVLVDMLPNPVVPVLALEIMLGVLMSPGISGRSSSSSSSNGNGDPFGSDTRVLCPGDA